MPLISYLRVLVSEHSDQRLLLERPVISRLQDVAAAVEDGSLVLLPEGVVFLPHFTAVLRLHVRVVFIDWLICGGQLVVLGPHHDHANLGHIILLAKHVLNVSTRDAQVCWLPDHDTLGMVRLRFALHVVNFLADMGSLLVVVELAQFVRRRPWIPFGRLQVVEILCSRSQTRARLLVYALARLSHEYAPDEVSVMGI